MAGDAGQMALFGPSTVSVHDNGKMPRNAHGDDSSTGNENAWRIKS
jgi:hypothetical protein